MQEIKILAASCRAIALANQAIANHEQGIANQSGTVFGAIVKYNADIKPHLVALKLQSFSDINKYFYAQAEVEHNKLQAELVAKAEKSGKVHAVVDFKSDSLRTMCKLYWFAVREKLDLSDYNGIKTAYKLRSANKRAEKNTANPPSTADSSASAIAEANGFKQPTITESTKIETVNPVHVPTLAEIIELIPALSDSDLTALALAVLAAQDARQEKKQAKKKAA